MKNPEELELSLSVCSDPDFGCSKCLYNAKSPINGYYDNECLTELLIDTIAYIKQLKEENRKLNNRLNALHGAKEAPKGFIKLTRLEGGAILVNVKDIKAIHEGLSSTNICADAIYRVSETVDEIMGKIKEA